MFSLGKCSSTSCFLGEPAAKSPSTWGCGSDSHSFVLSPHQAPAVWAGVRGAIELNISLLQEGRGSLDPESEASEVYKIPRLHKRERLLQRDAHKN